MPPSFNTAFCYIIPVVRTVARASHGVVLVCDLACTGSTTQIEVAKCGHRLFDALETSAVAVKWHDLIGSAVDMNVRDRSALGASKVALKLICR